MRSTFSGLETAIRALQAQQQAIDVITHNIANANTPGYSRQMAVFSATPPYSVSVLSQDTGAGQMGTGVSVASVRRSRDSFVDYQIRTESRTQSRWDRLRDALKQVEVVVNEPSDSGLNSILSQYWQAWQDVANNPQDTGARRALVEQGDSLAQAFNHNYSQLNAIRQDVDRQIRLGTDRVNQLAQQIASLNTNIAQIEGGGQRANDLRDQRDLLLDELASFTRVTYSETTEGATNVFIGSRALVMRDRTDTISYAVRSDGYADIVWQDDSGAVSIADGEFEGLMQARDTALPQFVDDLQALAVQLISSVNSLHRSGFGLDNSTGLDFFSGTGAGDIAINPTLKSNPEQVAAAGTGDSSGDNSLALAIAGLQREPTMINGTTDFGRFLASMVARLGVDTRRAEMMAGNQKLLVNHLGRQRESMSGVSLDEEATQLIQYQRAYQAAARLVNIVDEVLDRLINSVGLVGR